MRTTPFSRLTESRTPILPASPVALLVSRPPVVIESTETVAEAARLMRVERVSSLLVDGGCGIVTERDISRGVGAGVDPAEPVSSVATPRPFIVDGAVSIMDCAKTLLDEDIRHLVVELPDGSLGVISLRDVAAILMRQADHRHWWMSSLFVPRIPSENWLG